MIKDKTSIAILVLILIPLVLLSAVYTMADAPSASSPSLNQISEEPIQPSFPTNVVIRESAVYDAPIGDDRPIVHFEGVVYWEELAGAGLNFFINTSNVINDEFYDFETKEPLDVQDSCIGGQGFYVENCVEDQGDRYLIVPDARSFQYEIDAYYEPDIIQDTGFIVIFNSQSVDFTLTVDGEQRFANVDYSTRIVLPKGAGIVSYAPIDDGVSPLDYTEDGRVVLEWEYVNRAMDSKHDPLMISVTYAYDPIFLAFTEQVFQNQQEQQRQQEEINRLNLIQQSFVIIATLAVIASLFSLLFAYLLARRKFKPQLDRARELPRREASDIEDSPSLKVPIKSLFLSSMILIPMFFGPPLAVVDGQAIEDDTIQWKGTYDLRTDLTLTETVEMELPVERDPVYIYTNTSNSELKAFDEFGNPLQVDIEDNRYVISNPGFKFSYELERPYTVNNNSQMLVWLDRFWLEFVKPGDNPQDDQYFHVDMQYTVLLPEQAILYSASPSDLLTVDRKSTPGRVNVTFVDTDRQMDAFHDVFETQVTFSFVDIFDALENLNSDFVQVKAEQEDLNSLIRVAATEILLFSILGLIAPLISFFIAYWVFRRRYMKQIDRAEKEQEEKIFIESPQLDALAAASAKDAGERIYEAYKGHYYRALDRISRLIDRDASRLEDSIIMNELRKKNVGVDESLVMQVLSQGKMVREEDAIGYDQLSEYSSLVEEFLKEMN